MNEEQVTAEQIAELKQILEDMTGAQDTDNEILENFLKVLSVSDENFEILAPGIIQSFKQTLNNPNDKLALVQSLNAAGSKAEDLIEVFEPLEQEIDKLETISQPKKDFLKEVMASIINAIQETEGIAKRIIQIPIELCHPDAKIPQYAHIDDSGMDIYALDDYTIAPGETKVIPTGIKIALPPGYEIQVRPRSGLTTQTKLRIANTPGTIDAGYRDEIGVIVENVEPYITDFICGDFNEGCLQVKSVAYGRSFSITKGQKFAQLVLSEVPKAAFYRVDKVMDIGEDRGGGFGSTGA